VALQPSTGYGLLVSRGFLITRNDAPQSVGLIWTSDQSVTDTSIIGKDTISFMQGIYAYIPETNHVPKE
jgi:hypothetical protein